MGVPAVTGFGEAVFVMETSANVLTVVEVVFEVLLLELLSGVPFEATVALLVRTVPLATLAPTVTWTVKGKFPPTARPLEVVHVTVWPDAEHPELEPAM